MGKVKNLIWDEIELQNDQPPVRAIPTQGDIKAAAAARYEAFERFDADRKAKRDTTESHAAYRFAINHEADVNCQRFHAILMGEV